MMMIFFYFFKYLIIRSDFLDTKKICLKIEKFPPNKLSYTLFFRILSNIYCV